MTSSKLHNCVSMERKIKTFALGSIPFIFIFGFWQVLYQFAFVPQWLIPSPFETLEQMIVLIMDGTIIELVLKSALNALPAFVLALFISLLLGVIIGLSRVTDQITRPFLSALYTVPSLAWLPLVILFFGFSRTSVWCIIFLASFTKIIYTVIEGVRGVDAEWILIGKNVGLSSFSRVVHIIIPATLPSIMTGLRLGFAASWRSLVGTEMLMMSLGGIGRFIWMGQWNFDYTQVIIGVLVVAFIGILAERFFLLIEKRTLVRWGWL